jgi:hypothetical protein
MQSGVQPSALDIALEVETVRSAASLNARIVITIYSASLGNL